MKFKLNSNLIYFQNHLLVFYSLQPSGTSPSGWRECSPPANSLLTGTLPYYIPAENHPTCAGLQPLYLRGNTSEYLLNCIHSFFFAHNVCKQLPSEPSEPSEPTYPYTYVTPATCKHTPSKARSRTDQTVTRCHR